MARKGKIKIAIEPIEEEIRPVRSRKYVYFVLIVCEDENTEPAYFKQFEDLFEDLLPEETVYVKRVGTGRNSLGVVNAAIAERTRIYEENNHREIDETWVVFDKDDLDQTPGNRHNFESALTLSKERDIQVAYSNECFELWLLLHFNDVNGRKLRYSGGASRKAFEKYLKNVYQVASTFSLSREMKKRPLHDIQPGDIFVYAAVDRPGHKIGHAVMVADVAVNKQGKISLLLIEGNTPAQDFHVMRNLLNPFHSPWFSLDEDSDVLILGVFRFKPNELRHF